MQALFHYLSLLSSLRWRILVSLGVVLVLTLAIIEAGVLSFVYATEQQAWQGRQSEAARNATETVATFMQHVQDSLTTVSLLEQDYLVTSPQVMSNLLQKNQPLFEIIRLDREGRVFASAFQDAPLLANLFTIPQSRWFREAGAGQAYLGQVQLSASNQPYLIVAIPAPDGGVVAGRLRMQVLWDVVGQLRFGRTGQAYVVDRDGRIIAHTNPEVVLAVTSISGRPELASPSGAGSGTRWNGRYTNFQGVPVVGTTSQVPGTGWVVLSELSQAEAFAASRQSSLLLGGGILLFGALLMVAAARVLQKVIFQPMDQLRAGAEQIGQGNLSYRVESVRQDEIGQVAAAFNQMVDRLHQRDEQLAARTDALAGEVAERRRAQEELHSLNATLEQRVAERTLALEEQASELEQINETLQAEIVERRRAEATLARQAAELTRSNAELEQFAYVASHDLQEPLRKVQAFGDRLQTKYADILDERGLDYLDRMRGAAARMQVLINSLLTYSRVTTRAQPFVPVHLSDVVKEVLSDLETGIERVSAQVEVGELAIVEADPLQMRQLFQNLIGNSLKFHCEEGVPAVKISGHYLNGNGFLAGPSPGNHSYQFMVQDNGIGFEQEYAERIFQVFQRLHGRSEYEGTGVGLAICRKIVARHGGQITAQSQPGQGATFFVTLPVKQEEYPFRGLFSETDHDFDG
jgi:signal transduction histidine kinase/HAMP domain-containing protein